MVEGVVGWCWRRDCGGLRFGDGFLLWFHPGAGIKPALHEAS